MEPRMIALQKRRRLNVELLEARIAPSHVLVSVPPVAAEGAQHVNDNSPHCFLHINRAGDDLRHPGRGAGEIVSSD